jgi:CBS domain containing-hemolysin-like protein
MSAGDILFTLIILIANAFFVAFEFSLVSARRVRLEQAVEAGSKRAVQAIESMQQLGKHIAGVQLGIAMTSLGLGAVAEPAIAHAFESALENVFSHQVTNIVGFLLALAVIIFLHMILGEMVPKNIALVHAESVLLFLVLPMRFFVIVFGPVIRLLDIVAGAVLKLFRIERRDELFAGGTSDEIRRLLHVSQEHGLIEDDQADLLTGAIAFSRRPVGEVMTRLDDIRSIPAGCPLGEVLPVFAETGFSRLPVVGRHGSLIGFVHVKDAVIAGEAELAEALSANIIRRMLIVREDRTLDEVLRMMRRNCVHVALVADNTKTTLGIVTLEDLLEELVGEITDETDQ